MSRKQPSVAQLLARHFSALDARIDAGGMFNDPFNEAVAFEGALDMTGLLEESVACHTDADISDDALIHAGSAVWADWRNHVPIAVRASWLALNRNGRAAVFLTAKAVTAYNSREKGISSP